ncbi:permease [Thiomicrospira aerophila AL3]|uniref:Permease n=1 Tax=Thiomicrospira aerophila AL3 TaxID=717772 RepID=W0DYH2_9GAMM|nr:LPS export ABC transporter permease LptG [Thiomicrospira aerophila]AHF01901.1 permease [Thiomicrospira aerophila AL3]
MKKIEWYLAQQLVVHISLVMVVILIILGFSEFMNQVTNLREDYTLSKAAIFSLLKMVVFAYEVFPIALLIGTLLALGGLANRAELTVLRVTGWSVKRLYWAVIKVVLVLWLLMALVGEFLAPVSESYATQMRAESLNRSLSVGGREGFWLKEPSRVIQIERVVSPTHLRNITLYQLEDDQVVSWIQAPNASFISDDTWQLDQAWSHSLSWQDRADLPHTHGLASSMVWDKQLLTDATMPLPIGADLIQKLQLDPRYMRFDELQRYINFLTENELDAHVYKLAYWQKWSVPITVMAMIALVLPLVLGSTRSVSMGQRIFVGSLIGLSFYLLNQFVGNMSVVYQFSAIVGAFLPSVMLLVVAVLALKRVR